MRFGTIAGRMVLVRDGYAIDVEQHSGGAFPADVVQALHRSADLRHWAAGVDWRHAESIVDGTLGPPVPRPGQVFAVALNYHPHVAETGFTAPEAPLVFTKFPSCITGPDAEITLPEGNVDWEVEVVAVVGAGGRNIDRAGAWAAVAGLTVGQDLSERVLQLAGTPPQFSLGKSYPGFGPIGPVAVSPDEFPDPADIGFECRLDGELVQSARTGEMIFPVDELVVRLSRVCPLRPGDLIFTGTPAGVGNRRNPPRYLRCGQTLVSRAEHIGDIRTRFVAGAIAAANS